MNLDMHCHLDLYPEPETVVDRVKKAGLYVLSVTTTPKAWEGTCGLAGGASRIRTAIGFHPQLAATRPMEIDLFDQIVPGTRYVGEIGLDGSKEFKTTWRTQISIFRHVLRSSHNCGGRIMSIHSRRAVDAVIEELVGIDGVPILHWFTGSRRQLVSAINAGCWFSVGPAMLSSKRGQELLLEIPRSRLLTESDGPFAKFGGATLFPWDVDIAIKRISALWKCAPREVEEVVEQNFRRLLA